MMKRTVAGLLLLSACLLFGASVWEGSAVVAGGGELPDTGYYVSTNSFPRNTIVDVKNLETDQTVRAIVAGGLNSPGLLVALSKDAAAAIGMNTRGIGRVRVTMPADPIAFSRFTEGLDENPDPDRNPMAAIAAAGAEAPKTVVTAEAIAEATVQKQEPATIPSDVSGDEAKADTESKAEAVAEAEPLDGGVKSPDEPLQTETEANQADAEAISPVEKLADAVDDEKIQEVVEVTPHIELREQEIPSTEPVDIPDDYVPPPALVETTEEAETEVLVEAEPIVEPVSVAESESIVDLAESPEEPAIIVDAPPPEVDTFPVTDTPIETALLEDAGSATLSVLDRLPEATGEDALPVLDLDTPEAMDAGTIDLSPSGDVVEISEAAEPATAEMASIEESEPAKADLTAESIVQELPGIVQTQTELVEPAVEEPAIEAISEPIPPQPEPGTVELVLEPADERPPVVSVEIPKVAVIEEPAKLVVEPQQALPPEEVSIGDNFLVEAIPPATAPALIQPKEPILPDSLDFVEPIPAIPEAKPAFVEVTPQVVVPQTVVPPTLVSPIVVSPIVVSPIAAKVPEKTVSPDKSTVKFKAPLVERLEKGKFYVQLGAFGKADSVNGILASIGELFPATVQAGGTVEKPVYRVFVGPVNLGESGALLMRFRKSGYPDAFVKEGS